MSYNTIDLITFWIVLFIYTIIYIFQYKKYRLKLFINFRFYIGLGLIILFVYLYINLTKARYMADAAQIYLICLYMLLPALEGFLEKMDPEADLFNLAAFKAKVDAEEREKKLKNFKKLQGDKLKLENLKLKKKDSNQNFK